MVFSSSVCASERGRALRHLRGNFAPQAFDQFLEGADDVGQHEEAALLGKHQHECGS